MKLIGSKETFGIEYQLSKKNTIVFGKAQLWIKQKYLGYKDEISPIRPLYDGLKFIAGPNLNEKKAFHLETLDQLDEINSIHFGESFDDFNIKVLREKSDINFYWKLIPNHFHNYVGYLSNSKSKLFKETISINEFYDTYLLFQKDYNFYSSFESK